MSYIEPGTWEEQADHCYRIIYEQGNVSIVKINKIKDDSKWSATNLFGAVYLTSVKFEHRADAVHYLRQFTQVETKEPTLLSLLTSIKEFLNSEPFPLTNCLDYIEL